MLCVILPANGVHIHDLRHDGVTLLTHEPRGLLDVASAAAIRLHQLSTVHRR